MAIQVEVGEDFKWYGEFLQSKASFQLQIFKITFMYVFQDRNVGLIGRSFVVLCLVAQMLGIIVKFIEDTKEKGLDSRSAESSFQIVTGCMVLYVYTYLSVHFKKIIMCLNIISKIRRGDDLLGQKMVENMLGKTMDYISIITIMFIPMAIFFGTAPLLVPILGSWIIPGNQTFQKSLPLLYDFHVNTDKYFGSLYALQLISISHLVCIILLLNVLQCTSIGVIVGQFQYIQYYLRETDNGYYKLRENKKKACHFLIERLKQIIKKHYQCIELFNLQQSMSNQIMLVTLLGVTVSLVISGTSAVLSINSNFMLATKMMVVYCGALVALIIMCAPSQFLYNSSYNMFLASYCTDWYEYPPRARLFIVLLLLRTQKLLVLTAGTIIDLNFETCSDVIKRSLSYVAAIRSLYASI